LRSEKRVDMEGPSSARYDRPIKIAEGIYWVGSRGEVTTLHCNPYLLIRDGEAILIDGGSRMDFPTVMMRILQAGIDPKQIVALIYQHSDPDLCGSMPNLIGICENPNLKIFSEEASNLFLSFYIHRGDYGLLHSIEESGHRFLFRGRTLHFIPTPYSHTAGSFVTYDPLTKTLFSSDLFGSLSTEWDLFLEFDEACFACEDYDHCPRGKAYCPLPDILNFHRQVMPSAKALRHALDRIKRLEIEWVAPQHGSIFSGKRDISFLIEKLYALERVGIDRIF